MLLSERVGASGEPRHAQNAGPWIVLTRDRVLSRARGVVARTLGFRYLRSEVRLRACAGPSRRIFPERRENPQRPWDPPRP